MSHLVIGIISVVDGEYRGRSCCRRWTSRRVASGWRRRRWPWRHWWWSAVRRRCLDTTSFRLEADWIQGRTENRRQRRKTRRRRRTRCGGAWPTSGCHRPSTGCRRTGSSLSVSLCRLLTSLLGALDALMTGGNDTAATGLRACGRVRSASRRTQPILLYTTNTDTISRVLVSK